MIRRTLLFVLFAGAAIGQTEQSEQVFRFAQAETPQGWQEMSNIMRSIAEIRDTSVDMVAGTMTVRGTTAQLGLAQWLFTELDQAPGAAVRGMQQYQIPGNSVPYVRIFFLANTTSPRAMQEIVNTLRSIGEIQRITGYTANAPIVLRGSYDQAELAAWLVPLLDLSGGVQPATAPLEHHYNDTTRFPATAVRVFRLGHATTPLAMQEMVNAVRSIAEIQRATAHASIATIVLRGTPEQIALAAWMVQQLDQQAQVRMATAVAEYPAGLAGLLPYPARPSDEIVKVAGLAHTGTTQELQELVNQIRATAGMQRIVYTTEACALTLRGTAVQMAAAERLIQKSDK
jgi:hypothetical protein